MAYRNPQKIYELPFLFSIAMIVFILPTLFAVVGNNILTDSEYIHYTLFSLVCFWSGIIGHQIYKPKQNAQVRYRQQFYEKKMSYILYVIMLMSFAAIFYLGGYEVDERFGGLYAVLLYPARSLRPATIMLFTLYLITPSKDKLFFLVLSFLVSLKIIIIDGRRSEVFNMMITIAFPLFFVRKVIIPKVLIIPAILVSIFIFTFLPTIRTYTLKGDFETIFTLSPTQIILASISNEDKTNEVVEAAKNMQVVSVSGDYTWGTSMYNSIINQFASKTLFGEDVKESLTITQDLNLEELRSKDSKTENDYFKFYMTPTGFTSAFYEFGNWGFILFFLFGLLSKKLLLLAADRDKVPPIFIYCFFATFILYSIYDSILAIPTFMILYLVVYFIATKFSKVKSSTAFYQSKQVTN